jgi:subfamily B ATP-binding cassette protein MsbA
MSNPDKLLVNLARQHITLIIINFILSFSGFLFNGFSTALIIPILIGILSPDDFNIKGLPSILQKLFALFDIFPDHTRSIAMLVAVVLLISLKSGSQYLATLAGGHLNRSLMNQLRLQTVDMLLNVDIDFFSHHKIGELSSRCNNDTGRVVRALQTCLGMATKMLTIFTFLVVLLWLSWQLTLTATFLLGILAIVNQYFVKKSKQIGYMISHTAGDYTNKFLEILQGIRLIKTTGTETQEYQELKRRIELLEDAQFQSQVVTAAIGPINEVAGLLIVVVMVLLGRFLLFENSQSFFTLILIYLAILFRLLPIVSSLNADRTTFANSVASTEIITAFVSRNNKSFMVNNNTIYTGFTQEIKFENISFSYPNNKQLVLKNINLSIPKGKTIALVGYSGSGKSTTADLLARFYDPTEGRIIIDGKDMRDYDIQSLRQKMGIVSQDTFLFNNTVAYNIAYGLEQVTEADIIEVCQRANAYEFIIKLPKGFETEIGERGVILSGGQKQRLAIARALLRNPDILILDEATSALDTISERLVQQAIEELCRDRTTLVIAHRLSTVQNAYQIAVLDEGHIVELGNHQELLAKDGYYRRLYSMQFAENS